MYNSSSSRTSCKSLVCCHRRESNHISELSSGLEGSPIGSSLWAKTRRITGSHSQGTSQPFPAVPEPTWHAPILPNGRHVLRISKVVGAGSNDCLAKPQGGITLFYMLSQRTHSCFHTGTEGRSLAKSIFRYGRAYTASEVGSSPHAQASPRGVPDNSAEPAPDVETDLESGLTIFPFCPSHECSKVSECLWCHCSSLRSSCAHTGRMHGHAEA